MPVSLFTDDALRAAGQALNGLALRQELIGRNLANADTPGYLAQGVEFESALRRALEGSSSPTQMRLTDDRHLTAGGETTGFQIVAQRGGTLRADGNNVDIEAELNQMAETGIRYQALTQLVSKKFLLMRTLAASR